MAAFSDYVKNIFWVLVLLQFAPIFIRGIRAQYSDMFEEKTRVGVVPISGYIGSSNPTIRDMKKFFEDKSIKAIVLRINSQGGTGPAGQAIFQELLHYKKQHPEKYVVAYIEQMAASAAYYIASAGDFIISVPSAAVGSIGVLIQHPNIKQLLDQFNVSYSITKSGDYKGLGSPFLELSAEDKALFQSMTDDSYRQFIRDVTAQRPQLPSNTKLWADGKIFTGEQAFGLKLVDELGSPSTVEKVLRDKAQIVGRIEWVKPVKKRPFLASLFSPDDEDEGTTYLAAAVNSICNTLESRYAAKPTLS